jgi:hypothetical protein
MAAILHDRRALPSFQLDFIDPDVAGLSNGDTTAFRGVDAVLDLVLRGDEPGLGLAG